MSPYLINIDHWGPSGWAFLHAVSFTTPSTMLAADTAQYTAFFASLQHILPCPMCQDHLVKHYANDPIDVSSPRRCSEWLFRVHNAVNLLTGKPLLDDYLKVVLRYVPPSMWAMVEPSDDELRRLHILAAPSRAPLRTDRGDTWSVLLFLFVIAILLVVCFCVCVRGRLRR
jgi:hypothetical protein